MDCKIKFSTFLLCLCAATAALGTNSAFAGPSVDVNGDGYGDLIIGFPFDSVGDQKRIGAARVLKGSFDGLTNQQSNLLYQRNYGIAGRAIYSNGFAYSIATGDFDNDGYSDAIFGVPAAHASIYNGFGFINVHDAGEVHVFYGSPVGMTMEGNRAFNQGMINIPGYPASKHHWGEIVASGDFDGDGYDDAVIGLRPSYQKAIDGGKVTVIHGGPGGLSPLYGSQLWHQDSPGIKGESEIEDYFGSMLTTSDFNGDGYADLAVSAPREAIGNIVSAGAVNIIYGSVTGLTAEGNQLLHQNSPKSPEVAEAWDMLGSTLTGGDFNGDGYDDLVVGVPYEDTGTVSLSGTERIRDSGVIHIAYGSSKGLTNAGNQLFSLDDPEIEGQSSIESCFGLTLAAGDFNSDGYDDLAVSSQNPDKVTILYGSDDGLQSSGSSNLAILINPYIEVTYFGRTLFTDDFDGDGHDDLVIGAGINNEGVVFVYSGSNHGLVTNEFDLLTQDSITSPLQSSDYYFGWSFPGSNTFMTIVF